MRHLPLIADIADGRSEILGPSGALGPEARDRIGKYLLESKNLQAGSPKADPFDATLGDVVPNGVSTDGTWAWHLEWGYYVLAYGFAPPGDFLLHVEEHGAEPVLIEGVELIKALEDYESDFVAGVAFVTR
jgi:hypothetical protein